MGDQIKDKDALLAYLKKYPSGTFAHSHSENQIEFGVNLEAEFAKTADLHITFFFEGNKVDVEFLGYVERDELRVETDCPDSTLQFKLPTNTDVIYMLLQGAIQQGQEYLETELEEEKEKAEEAAQVKLHGEEEVIKQNRAEVAAHLGADVKGRDNIFVSYPIESPVKFWVQIHFPRANILSIEVLGEGISENYGKQNLKTNKIPFTLTGNFDDLDALIQQAAKGLEGNILR
ncbi:hypothetical protein ACFL35_05450 [Candidatus Riflebacteria bacterium]